MNKLQIIVKHLVSRKSDKGDEDEDRPYSETLSGKLFASRVERFLRQAKFKPLAEIREFSLENYNYTRYPPGSVAVCVDKLGVKGTILAGDGRQEMLFDIVDKYVGNAEVSLTADPGTPCWLVVDVSKLPGGIHEMEKKLRRGNSGLLKE